MKRKYTRNLFTKTLSAFTLLAVTLPATAAYNFIDTTLTGTDSKINNSRVIVPSLPVTAANSTTISSFDVATGAISVLYSNDGVIDSLLTNNLNDVVWRNSVVGAGVNSYSIMFYQGNSAPANIVQISNPGVEGASPRLNNRGDVAWEELTLGAPSKSYYRDPISGKAFELVAPSFFGLIRNNIQPKLNDSGNIIWNAFFLPPSLTSISSEVYFSRKGTSIPLAISTLTTPTSYIFASDINDLDEIALGRMEPLPNSIFGPCKIQKYDNKGNLLADVNGMPLPPVADFATCPSGGSAYIYLLNNGNVLYMFPNTSSLNELFFYDASTLATTSLGINVNSVAYNKSGRIVWSTIDNVPNTGLFLRQEDTGKIVQIINSFATVGGINDKGDFVYRNGISNKVTVAVYTAPPPAPPKPPTPPAPPTPPTPPPAPPVKPEPPVTPKPPIDVQTIDLSVNSIGLDFEQSYAEGDIDFDLGAAVIDPTDYVSVSIDGMKLFSQRIDTLQDDGGILVFDDGVTIVELDLNNANIIFEVDDADLDTIDPIDGLDIILAIGAAVGNTNYMQLNIDTTQGSQDTED